MNRLYKKTFLYCYLINYINRIENFFKRRSLHKNAAEILSRLNLVFNELNQDYWLEFGTLLGAIREKKIISFDLDLDIATWKSNYSNNLVTVMQKYGFKLVREIHMEQEGIEQTYCFKKVNIDIFYFEQISKGWATCHVFYLDENMNLEDMNKKYGGLHPLEVHLPFSGLITYNFLGVDVKIPDNYVSQLSYHYGDDYMLPNPNWNYRYANSSKQISNKVGEVKLYS